MTREKLSAWLHKLGKLIMNVFINYNHGDHSHAEAVKTVLSKHQIACFAFEQDIRPGEDIAQRVREAMQNATHLVLILSSRSFDSKWVSFELGLATGLGTAIVPYLVDGKSTIPPFLGELRCARSLEELRDYFTVAIDSAASEQKNASANASAHSSGMTSLDYYLRAETTEEILSCQRGKGPTHWHVTADRALQDWKIWLRLFHREYQTTMYVAPAQVAGRPEISGQVGRIQKAQIAAGGLIRRFYIFEDYEELDLGWSG